MKHGTSGVVAIPASYRKYHNLNPGDEVQVLYDGIVLIVRPLWVLGVVIAAVIIATMFVLWRRKKAPRRTHNQLKKSKSKMN